MSYNGGGKIVGFGNGGDSDVSLDGRHGIGGALFVFWEVSTCFWTRS